MRIIGDFFEDVSKVFALQVPTIVKREFGLPAAVSVLVTFIDAALQLPISIASKASVTSRNKINLERPALKKVRRVTTTSTGFYGAKYYFEYPSSHNAVDHLSRLISMIGARIARRQILLDSPKNAFTVEYAPLKFLPQTYGKKDSWYWVPREETFSGAYYGKNVQNSLDNKHKCYREALSWAPELVPLCLLASGTWGKISSNIIAGPAIVENYEEDHGKKTTLLWIDLNTFTSERIDFFRLGNIVARVPDASAGIYAKVNIQGGKGKNTKASKEVFNSLVNLLSHNVSVKQSATLLSGKPTTPYRYAQILPYYKQYYKYGDWKNMFRIPRKLTEITKFNISYGVQFNLGTLRRLTDENEKEKNTPSGTWSPPVFTWTGELLAASPVYRIEFPELNGDSLTLQLLPSVLKVERSI